MRHGGLKSEASRILLIVSAASIPFDITLGGFPLVDDIKMIFRGIYPDRYPIFHDPLLIQKGFFRPLVIALCRLDGLVWTASAGGYRFTNICLFALTSVLVYVFLRRFTHPRAAWYGALVFAIHPIQVGTVAWISGRVDLLPGLLLMVTAFLLVGTSGIFAVVVGNVVFAAALFSKEVAITFPAVVLLGEIFLADKSLRAAIRRAAIPTVMVLMYILARFGTEFWPHDVFYSPARQVDLHAWLGNVFILITNIIYLPFPFWSPMDFFRQVIEPGPHRASLLKPVILYVLSLTAVVVFLITRVMYNDEIRRKALFGIAWFLLATVPSFHVLRAMGGSRYLFPALPGAALLIAVSSRLVRSRLKGIKLYSLAVTFLAICLAGNIVEQRKWREAMDLAETTARQVEVCASRLPYRSTLVIFGMPPYAPGGRPLYPSYDTYSLEAAYRLRTGHPRIRVARGNEKLLSRCKTSDFYCVSWNRLVEGECPPTNGEQSH